MLMNLCYWLGFREWRYRTIFISFWYYTIGQMDFAIARIVGVYPVFRANLA